MSKQETRVLIGLTVLVIVILIGVGATWYITRVIPASHSAQTQVYYDVTARARDRD